MKIKLIVSCITAIVVCSSCATIIHGSKQEVGISSTPSSATVIIDNREIGKTPLTYKLSRKDNHLVTLKLDGFMPYETNFTRKVDGWIAGNIIFGGLIGLGIDAITGGMYKLSPDQIQTELRTGNASNLRSHDGIYFAVVLEPNPNWEKIGQLQKAD